MLFCHIVVLSQTTTDSVKVIDKMKNKTDVQELRKFTIKINPLLFVVKGYEVSAEIKIIQQYSIQATLNHWNYSFLGNKEKALSAFGEWRWYLQKSHPCLQGGYIGAYLRYNVSSTSSYGLSNTVSGNKLSEYEFSTLSLSGTWGKQWITKGGFLLNIFFGGGMGMFLHKNIIYEKSIQDRDPRIKNDYLPNFRLGFAIGFAN
jgi:hypothetical protein